MVLSLLDNICLHPYDDGCISDLFCGNPFIDISNNHRGVGTGPADLVTAGPQLNRNPQFQNI